MPREKDSARNTFLVAVTLSLVCSVLVSAAAVGLRPLQNANKERFRRQNVLKAAGLYERGIDVDRVYEERVEPLFVNLDTGRPATSAEISAAGIDSETYDQRKAARDPKLSEAVRPDPAGLKRRERFAPVFVVKDEDGRISKYVFPIRGYGLWSTLWGFLAVAGDTTTIEGITYYEHGETPGLGGEVDNPNWQAQWPGRQLFDPRDLEQPGVPTVELRVYKAGQSPAGEHAIDGLAGATITTRGIDNMVGYWLGEHGFGPYLQHERERRAGNGVPQSP